MPEAEFRWTQDDWGTQEEATALQESRRNNRLAWFAVITLAFVVFELTANAMLSMALGCLKFGWDQYRMSRWLKRTDPNRTRGRICSWFYLAWGFWRSSLVATAVMFAIPFGVMLIEGKQPNAPKRDLPSESLMALLLAFLGFSASGAISTVAVVSALRRKVKVWVGPEVRWAIEDGVWPPQLASRRRLTKNRAGWIIASAGIMDLGFVILVSALLALGRKDQVGLGGVAFIGFNIFVLPLSILMVKDTVSRILIAHSPEACWAVDESP
jgi:hypothetical protein